MWGPGVRPSQSGTMWQQCTRASRKRQRLRGHPAAASPCVTVGASGKRPLCGLTAPPRLEQRSRSQRHPIKAAWAPRGFLRPLFPPPTQPRIPAGGEECLCLCRRRLTTATRLHFFSTDAAHSVRIRRATAQMVVEHYPRLLWPARGKPEGRQRQLRATGSRWSVVAAGDRAGAGFSLRGVGKRHRHVLSHLTFAEYATPALVTCTSAAAMAGDCGRSADAARGRQCCRR